MNGHMHIPYIKLHPWKNAVLISINDNSWMLSVFAYYWQIFLIVAYWHHVELCILVTTGEVYGLVPDGTKPLP